VGASLHRDSVDARLIAECGSLGLKGRVIHDEAETGGIGELKGGNPPVSTVGDSIPDAWKLAHGLDPKNPNGSRDDDNHDGYSILEEYLNALAGDALTR